MFVHPDEAYWDASRLADILGRVHATAHALGHPPRPPRPLPVHLPGDPDPDQGRDPCSPVRGAIGEPRFGGIADRAGDDEAAPVDRSGRRRQVMIRLQVRSLLYSIPATPCSTQEIASLFALREGDVRQARPRSAMKIGRAWAAPFGHWLASLQRAGLVPVWPEESESPARAAAPPPTTGRHRGPHRTGQLRPLGGPGRG